MVLKIRGAEQATVKHGHEPQHEHPLEMHLPSQPMLPPEYPHVHLMPLQASP